MMTMKWARSDRWRSAIPAAVAAVLLAACATLEPVTEVGDGPASPSPITAELAQATFDSAWSQIASTYYDSTFGGLDWEGVRAELRPRAAEARTNPELRAVLSDMLGRLGDSHFEVIPGEYSEVVLPDGTGSLAGDVGMDVRFVEDELVVVRVTPGSPAAAAGVGTGWAITSAAGERVSDWTAAMAAIEGTGAGPPAQDQMVGRAMQSFLGEAGTEVEIEFLDGDDHPVRMALERRRQAGEPIRLGNLPTIFGEVEHSLLSLDEGCVGLVRFNVWMAPLAEPVLRAVDELSGCDGFVVDMRGNMGGLLAMVPAVAGAFLQERSLIGTLRMRSGDQEFFANPRRATFDGEPTGPFRGPVAILVDDFTVSAAELFTAGLQGNRRARVFGLPTRGEALPSQTTRLPNGDIILHAFADFTGPDGRRLEGVGIVPDVTVTRTRADLLQGRDRPLEAALEWMADASEDR